MKPVSAPTYVSESVELWLGDCLDVLPALGLVDHVITDPPFEAEAHTLQRRIKQGMNLGPDVMVQEPLTFSALTEEERISVCRWASTCCNGWLLAFCQAEAVALWRDTMEAAGVGYKRSMVWVKPDGMPQFSGDRPGMGYESIAAGWCGDGKSKWNGGGRHGVFVFPKNSGGKHDHQTQKPIPLMNTLVNLFTNEGETILDCFMGSGTTGIACIRTGRRFIGIEKSPEHFATALERIKREEAQGKLL